MTAPVALPLRIGARTVWRVRRRLARVAVPLEQGLSGAAPPLPPLQSGSDGYLVTSLPAAALPQLTAQQPGLRVFLRQSYPRSYAELDRRFDDYLAGFSAKSRSTLKRKVRRFAETSGGALDLRCYSAPDEVEEFYRHARAVSARTYQERLLDAGLPAGDAALADMRERARRGAMRGWVLFLDAQPVSYLYAPAEGSTLVYAYLGYDPAHANLSPGTVLQLEAMRMLMEEGRFRLFDFTEGDGQHKRQFATGSVECVDLLLLRPTIANILAGHGLGLFDRAVAGAKAASTALGIEKVARSLVR